MKHKLQQSKRKQCASKNGKQRRYYGIDQHGNSINLPSDTEKEPVRLTFSEKLDKSNNWDGVDVDESFKDS